MDEQAGLISKKNDKLSGTVAIDEMQIKNAVAEKGDAHRQISAIRLSDESNRDDLPTMVAAQRQNRNCSWIMLTAVCLALFLFIVMEYLQKRHKN